MVYHISSLLKQYINCFNVAHYISVRLIASLLTSLTISIFAGSYFIKKANRFFKSSVREYTPENHKSKANTPTMGGLYIIASSIITSLIWCDLTKPEVLIFMLLLISFTGIGFWDDWYKIKYNIGIKEKQKFIAQIICSAIIVVLWLYLTNYNITSNYTILCIPFFKNICLYLGLLIIPWAMFIITGTSNAVNLTDGLDGLATTSLIMNFITFSCICYLSSNVIIAEYLHIPFTQTGEIAIIGASLAGSLLGFLWYNTYPSQIFMGDTGALPLGAALAFMAIMVRQELLLPITGGLFVVETLSVIIQVISFKRYGKRIFKMSPIHHHFELSGWHESKITVRFGIISLILCLLALITLKIR